MNQTSIIIAILISDDRPKYKGFLIDLLEDIRRRSPRPMDYELYLSPDGMYGVESRHSNDTVTWNGMIGELVKEVRPSIIITDIIIIIIISLIAEVNVKANSVLIT